jgi:hypothetical protein
MARTFRLWRLFGDSSELKQNRHEQVEAGGLRNPCASKKNQAIVYDWLEHHLALTNRKGVGRQL